MPARRAASRRTSRILCATSDRADERRSGPAHSKLRFALIVIPSLPRCAQLCPLRLIDSVHGMCGLEVTGHTHLSIFKYRRAVCEARPCVCQVGVGLGRGAGGGAGGGRAGGHFVESGLFRTFHIFFGETREAQGGPGARPREGVIIAVFSTFFLVSLSRAVADERRARTIQSSRTSTRRVQKPSDPSWNTCQTWRLLPSPAIGLSPSLKGCSFTAGDLDSWCQGQATGMLTGTGLRCICVSVEPKTLRGGAG